MLSPRNSLAESNQFHGLSITEDITPIFSFPLLPIFPACLLCQWPCSAGPDWPGGGTRTHLFHPGALEEMPSSLIPSLSPTLFPPAVPSLLCLQKSCLYILRMRNFYFTIANACLFLPAVLWRRSSLDRASFVFFAESVSHRH